LASAAKKYCLPLAITVTLFVLMAIVTPAEGSNGKLEPIGVSVYWDYNLTQPCSAINWGDVRPGSIKNVTVFIKNDAAIPVTLSLRTVNWNPEHAASYFLLELECEKNLLEAKEVVTAHFKLKVAQDIAGITTFDFMTLLIATGYEN
jgi:hypothetical protein